MDEPRFRQQFRVSREFLLGSSTSCAPLSRRRRRTCAQRCLPARGWLSSCSGAHACAGAHAQRAEGPAGGAAHVAPPSPSSPPHRKLPAGLRMLLGTRSWQSISDWARAPRTRLCARWQPLLCSASPTRYRCRQGPRPCGTQNPDQLGRCGPLRLTSARSPPCCTAPRSSPTCSSACPCSAGSW